MPFTLEAATRYMLRSAPQRAAADELSELDVIEREVQQLDDESFAPFREWSIADDWARWDRQAAKDRKGDTPDPQIH